MNGTGSAEKTPRRKLTLVAVVPSGVPEKDFEKVKNSVFVAEDEAGQRTTWTGVTRLKVGEKKWDGKEAATRTIELLVTGDRIIE